MMKACFTWMNREAWWSVKTVWFRLEVTTEKACMGRGLQFGLQTRQNALTIIRAVVLALQRHRGGVFFVQRGRRGRILLPPATSPERARTEEKGLSKEASSCGCSQSSKAEACRPTCMQLRGFWLPLTMWKKHKEKFGDTENKSWRQTSLHI